MYDPFMNIRGKITRFLVTFLIAGGVGMGVSGTYHFFMHGTWKIDGPAVFVLALIVSLAVSVQD